MKAFLNDLRFGARMLRKQPGSSAIAIIALALGIGLTSLMFSIVYGAMLRGLPFEESERILTLSTSIPSENRLQVEPSVHDFTEWRAEQKSFEDLSASNSTAINLSDGANPERYEGAFVTPEMFPLLRVQPVLGRSLQTADNVPGAPDVMLIGFSIWQNRFGGDPSVIGRVERANGKPTTIIGVMPDRFAFPESEQIWLPLRQDPARVKRGEGQRVDVIGRLRHGVSIDAARAEFSAIAQRIATAHPETNKGAGVTITPYIESSFGPEPIAMLYTMLGAVFLVLLIACTNVANLLISRAAARSKEVGVRTALGASRYRIVRQFMAESLIISFAGALLGLGIAFIGTRMFSNAIVDTNPPFWIDVKVDGGVLLFVFAITLLSTMLAGAFPAFSAAGTKVSDVLKDEARGSSSLKLGRLSRVLVVFEIALSAGLLVGAGLIIKSITKLRTVDYGFETRSVFTGHVSLTDVDYPDEATRVRFYNELVEKVRALPGVQSAAIASSLPGRGSGRTTFAVEGVTYPDERYPFAGSPQVSPDYFSTLKIGIVSGRAFTAQDDAASLPVAIVTQSLARAQFGTASPIGRRVRLSPDRDRDEPFRTIVGVVPDSYINGLTEKEQSGIFIPFAQSPAYGAGILARVDGNPLDLTKAVRGVVTAMDPDQPMFSTTTLQHSIDEHNWFYLVFGSLFMSFGLAALFLASVGLYGVMATSVNHRTREMGVRMALGANRGDVLRLVMNEGLIQLGVGLVLGLVFALGVSRLLSMLLFQVDPRDPATFVAIGTLLVLTAIVATFVPALRATRVQPVQAMRDD
ncbi:MAG: ABC transporter permease [Longimicrobiales bacterium]